MDYGFARAKQHWEASDGAVYLLREVAASAPADVAALLPVLASVAALDGFAGCWQLKENIWKQLPEIASSMGVQVSASGPPTSLRSQKCPGPNACMRATSWPLACT